MNWSKVENGVIVDRIIVNPDNLPKLTGDWRDDQALKIGMVEDVQGSFKKPEPLPPSTDPLNYTHTRRQFRDLLTASQEAEIEAAIKAETKPKIKRALRNWWNHTSVYEWDDREMVKMLTLVTPETAAAIETAWIKQRHKMTNTGE